MGLYKEEETFAKTMAWSSAWPLARHMPSCGLVSDAS